jgi:hypothetical protein
MTPTLKEVHESYKDLWLIFASLEAHKQTKKIILESDDSSIVLHKY